MYNVEKRSAPLEDVAGFAKLDAYIRSGNKMAALEYVYTLGKQTLRSPGARFLEVQIPVCVLVYD